MCGVVGLVELRARAEDGGLDRLRSARDALTHRGPDAAGDWSAPVGPNVAYLGHRRLSIIDLSPAGAQPMASADERFFIAYNGEIYNFRELRATLDSAGALPSLRGGSDTEILLAAISHWGVDEALQRIRGMFAFGLVDRERGVLTLARDAFGEKPLYYGAFDGAMLFASEIKALKTHPAWRGEINRAAIGDCLAYGYIPGARTAVADVHKLLPGEIVDVDLTRPIVPDGWSRRRWFDPVAEAGEVRRSRFVGDVDAAVNALEALLERVIERQLISDVPIGALLSGGIDSSLISAIAQKVSAAPLKTFSLGFREAAFDESVHARAVAEHLGTEHHEIMLQADDALDLIERMPMLFDEPFTDPSQLPTYLVSRFARGHVTVALTGDGGDEMFAGYDRYLGFADRSGGALAPLKRLSRRASTSARSAVADLVSSDGEAFRRREKAAREPAPNDGPASAFDRFTKACASASDLAPAASRENAPLLGAIDAAARGWPADARDIEAASLLDLAQYLPDDILVKVDRAAMAVSLEGRMPFLDVDVARFALSLPDAIRRADGKPKGLLRRLLARHVPPKLFERPKRGFTIPLADWMRGPFRSRIDGLLSRDRLEAQGLFDAERTARLWTSFLAGERTPPHVIWMLFMINLHLEHAAGPALLAKTA